MYARSGSRRFATSTCAALILAACGGGSGDGPTEPGHIDPLRNAPGIHAVLGAGVTDTIDAQPLQALVVEVRRPDGQLATGAVVRFQAQPPSDSTRKNEPAISVCALTAPTCGQVSSPFTSDTTDAQGRAKATVRLGHVAGRAVVRLTVPEFGMEDSATYTVQPGAAARVRALAADTALAIGATANLRGHVVDRYNNSRPEVPVMTAGTGGAISLDAGTGVVTARQMGTQWIFMSALQASIDSTRVRVLPSGRLVVWSSSEASVRLVNLDGSATRNIATSIASDLGAFPRFDGTRKNITLHDGTGAYGGPANTVSVIDTTGSPRRDIGQDAGFTTVIAARQLADGTLLVVGKATGVTTCTAFALFRVAADNSLTCLAALPGLGATYGGADISHDGTRVAYVAPDPATPLSSSLQLRVLDVGTGATTILEAAANTPRWSLNDDRLAYLIPNAASYNMDGTVVIINADGTGRKALGSFLFSPGLAWSPDGAYVVGRNSGTPDTALRLIRVSDGADVLLRFKTATGGTADYYQPDWR